MQQQNKVNYINFQATKRSMESIKTCAIKRCNNNVHFGGVSNINRHLVSTSLVDKNVNRTDPKQGNLQLMAGTSHDR